LVDRNAIGVEREQIERALIRRGDSERELVHRHAEDAEKAFFADPAEPDTKLTKVTSWIGRVLRMRVTELTDAPEPGQKPDVSVEFFGSDGMLGRVSMWEPGEARDATILTSRFPSPAQVSRSTVKALIRDAEGVVNEGK
jgi:hypothetical protein